MFKECLLRETEDYSPARKAIAPEILESFSKICVMAEGHRAEDRWLKLLDPWRTSEIQKFKNEETRCAGYKCTEDVILSCGKSNDGIKKYYQQGSEPVAVLTFTVFHRPQKWLQPPETPLKDWKAPCLGRVPPSAQAACWGLCART